MIKMHISNNLKRLLLNLKAYYDLIKAGRDLKALMDNFCPCFFVNIQKVASAICIKHIHQTI